MTTAPFTAEELAACARVCGARKPRAGHKDGCPLAGRGRRGKPGGRPSSRVPHDLVPLLLRFRHFGEEGDRALVNAARKALAEIETKHAT